MADYYRRRSNQQTIPLEVIAETADEREKQIYSGVVNSDNGAQAFDLSLLDKPGFWTVQANLVVLDKTGVSTLATWTIQFTVPA